MKYFLLVLILLVVFIAYQTIRTRRYIAIGIGLANSAIPYEQDGDGLRILVIGDSTAVGTGAEISEGSIAGLVGKKFPQASIKNLGVNGAVTSEIIPRLEQDTENYDLIMIHVGGNDTRKFLPLDQLEADLNTAIDLAQEKAPAVTLTSTGSLGTAKLLPFGVRWLYTRQTYKVRNLFKRVAEEQGIPYANILRPVKEDPFAQQPKKYYSADWFHPSSEGYADWFQFIELAIDQALEK